MTRVSLRRTTIVWSLALLLDLALPGAAAPVALNSVEASFHGGTPDELKRVIDGIDAGQHGWFVAPRTAERHALFLRTAEPLRAELLDVTLSFLSGRPGSYCAEFVVSGTTDVRPSMNGQWETLMLERVDSTGTMLRLESNGRLRPWGGAIDGVFQVRVRAPKAPLTGFRLEVFPRTRTEWGGEMRVGWGPEHDFLLTEFRVFTVETSTTNVALGCPVRASHPVWGYLTAASLTDGHADTISHTGDPSLGAAFFFEIDLGKVRSFDHLALRSRSDGQMPQRLSQVTLALYEQPPDSGAHPVWQGRDRDDGSYPAPGEVDLIRAGNGAGIFCGRYLRISSDSPVAYSPQLAEVEAYESSAAELVSVRADGLLLTAHPALEVPPGTRWLALKLKEAGRPVRWRFRGLQQDWQPARGGVVELSYPAPGKYTFEAQTGHSDGEWDASLLSFPVVVRAHFWQTATFGWTIATAAGLTALAGTRFVIRRRLGRQLADLESKSALAEERARIAKDMHDEVGSRLAQLAILQDLFAREYPMPEAAQQNLQQLAQTAREAIASLDEVVWTVNPRNDTLPCLAEYLAKCASAYLAPLEIAFVLDAPLDWPPVDIHAQTRHELVLAFKEALQNVAKHSGASVVNLLLRYEAPHFVLCLGDNGKGLPDLSTGAGQDGLFNMKARLETLAGTCAVQRRPEGGTEVKMSVPLTR